MEVIMTLTEQINQDIKTAMKAKDKETLKVIRMLKAALQKEAIDQAGDLTADQELTIINREMKQRRDAMAEFAAANRQDLVADLEQEIAIVEKYLPTQLSEAEVKAKLEEIIAATGANSAKDFGKVMGQAMAQMKGQVDGNVVNKLVKELLA